MSSAGIDNEVFIAMVESHPALWQVQHRDYKNKYKKRALWKEMAAAMLPDVPGGDIMLQKRWKSLRDRFRRMLTAWKAARKSGAGTEEVEGAIDITWPYFEQMLFLKDSMEGRPTSGNYSEAVATAGDLLEEMGQCRDIDCVSVLSAQSDDQEAFSLLPEVSGPAVPPEVPCKRAPLPAYRQRKKKKDDELQQELDDVSSRISNHKPLDDDEHFALSLVPYMRGVGKEHKLEMRVKLMQSLQVFLE